MNSIGVILIKTLKKGCRIYGLKERNPPLVYSYLGVFHHVSLVEYIQEGIYQGKVTLLDRHLLNAFQYFNFFFERFSSG